MQSFLFPFCLIVCFEPKAAVLDISIASENLSKANNYGWVLVELIFFLRQTECGDHLRFALEYLGALLTRPQSSL